ncbi:hypothetical protein KC19_7G053000 [Ceratodon purpureus]|uniref:Uncharacterized protein n=1 Tax=Ceratodon purpureus TaxID=3225 RepID=A0A8T0H320_CERPU|nr:hypothetical protein KC19_7G053000 [Ceratodon purpureus]
MQMAELERMTMQVLIMSCWRRKGRSFGDDFNFQHINHHFVANSSLGGRCGKDVSLLQERRQFVEWRKSPWICGLHAVCRCLRERQIHFCRTCGDNGSNWF